MFQTLPELIAEQSLKHGSKPALIVPESGETISFAELNERAGLIARWLREKGIRPGEVVALVLPNSSFAYQLLLGIMKLGAVPLMMDMTLKAAEVENFIQTCRASLFIMDAEFKKRTGSLRSACPEFLVPPNSRDWVDRFLNSIPTPGTVLSFPQPRIDSDAIALLITTSGTTNLPKAICLSHAALFSRCRKLRSCLETNASFTSLCCLPLAHCLYFCLSVFYDGGTLVLCPPLEIWKLDDFWKTVAKYQVNWIHLIPPVIRALIQLRSRCQPPDVSSMRFITSASAPLAGETILRFEKAYGITLLNCYGLKETGLIGITSPDTSRRRIDSVGQVRREEIRILDPEKQDVPPGQVGEIAFRADIVTTGYFGLREESRLAFHDDWFLTGDLGRVDEQNYLYIMGRCKDLIIHNGRKILPEEIDGVLRSHATVLDAATFGIPDELCGERVVSCVVARPGHVLSERELSLYCSRQLADYKRPQHIRKVDALPLASAGKIRRQTARLHFLGGLFGETPQDQPGKSS